MVSYDVHRLEIMFSESENRYFVDVCEHFDHFILHTSCRIVVRS